MNKIIKVPVEIKRDGILVEKCELKFREIIHPKGEFVCDKCPACDNDICGKLPNPENLNNLKSNFADFCLLLDIKRNNGVISECGQGIMKSEEIAEVMLTGESLKKLLKYER